MLLIVVVVEMLRLSMKATTSTRCLTAVHGVVITSTTKEEMQTHPCPIYTRIVTTG